MRIWPRQLCSEPPSASYWICSSLKLWNNKVFQPYVGILMWVGTSAVLWTPFCRTWLLSFLLFLWTGTWLLAPVFQSPQTGLLWVRWVSWRSRPGDHDFKLPEIKFRSKLKKKKREKTKDVLLERSGLEVNTEKYVLLEERSSSIRPPHLGGPVR